MISRMTILTAKVFSLALAGAAFYVAASMPGIMAIFGVIFAIMLAPILIKMLAGKIATTLTRPETVSDAQELPSLAGFALDAR